MGVRGRLNQDGSEAVYQTPALDGSSSGEVPAGAEFEIIRKHGASILVKFRSLRGWISNSGVVAEEASDAEGNSSEAKADA